MRVRAWWMIVGLGLAGPAVAGSTWFPGAGEYGALLFEDNWPCAGDADFNDAVIRYNVQTVDNGTQDVEIVVRINVHALGASVHNGLGLRIPGLDVSDVAYVRRIVGDRDTADGAPWSEPVDLALPASGDLDVRVVDDLHVAVCGVPSGFVNTVSALPGVDCAPLAVEVTLKSGAGTVPGAAPWDLYLARTEDPTHQIHRPQYPVPSALFGTCDDASDPVSGGTAWYTLTTPTPRVPAVLNVPVGYTSGGAPLDFWPRERVRIDAAAPHLVGFFSGGGAADWYESGTVPANLYAGGSAGADPLPPLRDGTVPDHVYADCEATRAASLPTWFRTFDLGGAVAPFVTHCDNDTQGGGWMLVGKRSQTGVPAQVAGLTDTTTTDRVLPDATWAALRTRDEMLILANGAPRFVFSMAQMRAANCVPLASSLTDAALAHDNAAGGCFSGGRDYAYVGWDAASRSGAGDCEYTPHDFTVAELPGVTCGYDGAVARCCYYDAAATSLQALYVR